MDKGLAEIARRLAAVRQNLGARVHRTAVQRALQAVAIAALAEAERRAQRRPRPLRRDATVIRFPLARARSKRGGDNGGGL